LAIPFSGGLDSMVLARLAHEYLPVSEAIDLVNVCFAVDHRSPDRIAAVEGLKVRRVLHMGASVLLQRFPHPRSCEIAALGDGTRLSVLTKRTALYLTLLPASLHFCILG
jgi:hypothetical protein